MKSTPTAHPELRVSGSDLMKPGSPNLPVGFYTSTFKSYTGIVFRDKEGVCSYIDREAGCVYPADPLLWAAHTYVWRPDIKSVTIGVNVPPPNPVPETTVNIVAN